jgi:hypothetical protein
VLGTVTIVRETLIFFVSVLFRPPVGKIFILNLAVGNSVGFSFVYPDGDGLLIGGVPVLPF